MARSIRKLVAIILALAIGIVFLIAFAQAASAGVVISAPNGLEGTGVVDASDEPALLPSQNEPATTTGVKPLNITGVLYGEPVVTPATGWEVQHVVLGDFGYDVLTITASGSYQIRMTSPGAVGIGWSLVVAKGVTAEITLDGASFWNMAGDMAAMEGRAMSIDGATVTLNLKGTNDFVGAYCGICVPAGSSLTVNGSDSDSLNANGLSGSGIGGGLGDDTAGKVTINGGVVTATGSTKTGIGGGGGKIVVNGGRLVANDSAAGQALAFGTLTLPRAYQWAASTNADISSPTTGSYPGQAFKNSPSYHYVSIQTMPAPPVSAAPLIVKQPGGAGAGTGVGVGAGAGAGAAAGADYYKGQAAAALKVSASSADGGVLKYQWYANSVLSTAGAKAVSGATKASFTPPTKSVGAVYYFCQVTNTVPGATAGKAVNTQVALVRVAPDLNKKLVTIVPDAKTGLRLDIPGQSLVAGVQAALWSNNGGPNQRFLLTRDASGLYRLKGVNSGLYLTVQGGKAVDGAAIVQGRYSTSKAQLFKVSFEASGKYTLTSALNADYVVGVSGASVKSAAAVVLQKRGAGGGAAGVGGAAASASAGQVFRLSELKPLIASGTVVTIKNVATGRYMDIFGNQTTNNVQLITYSATGGQNQQFRLTYNSATGYYQITPLHSLKPLTVRANQVYVHGATLYQHTHMTGFNQQWDIKKDSAGHYLFYQPSSRQVLSAANGSKALCTPVILWPTNGAPDQAWVLKKQ